MTRASSVLMFSMAVFGGRPIEPPALVAKSQAVRPAGFQMPTLVFDRFSDEALQVLWFARQAVSDVGGTALSPDHVLIGLLRSNPQTVGHFLRSPDSSEAIATELSEKVRVSGKPPAESEDLPLTASTDRVLRRAIEESDALGTKSVRPEHILLALLHESIGRASTILRDHSITTETVTAYLKNEK